MSKRPVKEQETIQIIIPRRDKRAAETMKMLKRYMRENRFRSESSAGWNIIGEYLRKYYFFGYDEWAQAVSEQSELFPSPKPKKTYRAIRHDVVRARQRDGCQSTVHTNAKAAQINRVLNGINLRIFELFAGNGNLTHVYKQYGAVTAYDKKLGTGDSFREYHRMIADGKKFDVIDLDPYGFPSRFMPDIFLLIESGFLFLTCPIASVNILHDITKTHLFAFYGDDCPDENVIAQRIALYGLCHWRKVELVDYVRMDRMHRFAFKVERVAATKYCGVKNR